MHPADGDTSEGGDLRRNPVSGDLTIVAPARRARPVDNEAAAGASRPPCPFCPGHEAMTPPEVDALRDEGVPNTAGWRVRVVPNKFPVLARGHEVIVHSPSHEAQLEDLSLDAAGDVIAMYQRRLGALLKAGAPAVSIIHNRGSRAGASLDHPHSQVLATPVVPPVLQDELENLDRYRNRYGTCLLCDLATDALAELELLSAGRAAGGRAPQPGDEALPVFAQEGIVAWVPRAARFAYETWLSPVAHEADFRDGNPRAVAGALQRALRAVGAASHGAPLNFWLHTAPRELRGIYHWHIEIAPRLSALAGFEIGTGITIDEVEAGEAAARLRGAAAS